MAGYRAPARRLMSNWVYFLGSVRNYLAVKPCIARRHKPVTQFWVFLMNCLAVMSTRQATRAMFA